MAEARTAILLVLAVAASGMLSGCTAASDAPPDAGTANVASVAEALAVAREHRYKWEISVLKDGVISATEYEQAYDRYMQCQRDLGYVFDKPKYLDPIEGQRWQALSAYRGPGNPPMGKMQSCDNRISLIETPYVFSTPKRMDPQLLEKFKQCLDAKGVKYTGKEVNFNDFTSELGDADYKSQDSPYTSCLLTSAYALFPDLISVGYGR